MDVDKKIGRPKKYETAFELEIAVDLYFMDCDDRVAPYTVEGLACALDVDRQTLLRYEKDEDDPERRHIVQRAKRRILQDLQERGLQGKGDRIVTIFNLKNNYGYVDKTETESVVKMEQIAGVRISGE